MTLNRQLIGREYRSPGTFEVGREHIRQFAEALGDTHPVYHDPDVARSLGYADVIAPPTFLTVLVQRFGAQGPIGDPALGLDYARVVHGDQTFVHHRPVIAGDVLRSTTVVTDIRDAGANEIVREEITVQDSAGDVVAVLASTVVSRGTAAGGQA